MELAELDVQLIEEGEERFREDYGDLEQLKDSLADKDVGQIQSLAVYPDTNGIQFNIIAGGRRLRAIKELVEEERHDGMVAVRIYPTDIDKTTLLSIELAENLNRLDMSWQEQMSLTKKIHDLNTEIAEDKGEEWTPGQTAELVGRHRTGVAREINLAEAIENIPELEECKSKDEAEKLYGKMQEELIIQEQARRIEVKQIETPLDDVRATIGKLYNVGDTFEGMAALPESSFDLIDLDPPYASEFETTNSINQERSGLLEKFKKKDFNMMEPENYPVTLYLMLEEAYRLLRPGGWLIMWYAQDPWANEVYERILEVGFKTKRIPAIWNKSLGERDMRFTASPDNYLGRLHETFYYCRKGDAKIVERARGDVFNFASPHSTKRIHPTEKPVQLQREILRTFVQPGASILSPFLGSGNTILAAAELGMACQGFELSQEYKDKFMVRLQSWDPAHPEG